MRDGDYASLLGEARRALHAAAATWFEELDPALHAEHLGRAGDPEAPRIFLAVAEGLAAEHRYERALQLIEQGIALASDKADRFALACRRSDLLQTIGDAEASIDAYRKALEDAEDDAGRCEAWIGIAAGIRLQGGGGEGLEALDQAQALTRADGFDRALAQIHHYRGNFHFGAGDIVPCLEQQELALGHAEREGDHEWQARAFGGLGDAYYARSRMSTSRDYFRRCIELCRDHALIRIEVANRYMVGVTRRYMNELDGALEDVLAATDMARRVGNRRAEMYALNLVGEFNLDRGRYDEVQTPMDSALVLTDTLGNRRFKAYAMMQIGRLRLARGRADDARSILDEAMAISRETGERFIGARVLGVAALAVADNAARIRCLGEGEAILAQECAAHNHQWFYRDAIEASLGPAAWDEAARFSDALSDFTRAEPLPWSDFFVARGRVLASFGRGERSALIAAELEELRDEAERTGFAPQLAALNTALEEIGENP